MAQTYSQLIATLERLEADKATCCVWRPPADVYRTRAGWLIKFDIAGVNPQELKVVLDRRRLMISGVRRDALVQECLASYSLEISYNRFERVIELPAEVEPSHTRTEYRDGMLLVWIEEKQNG